MQKESDNFTFTRSLPSIGHLSTMSQESKKIKKRIFISIFSCLVLITIYYQKTIHYYTWLFMAFIYVIIQITIYFPFFKKNKQQDDTLIPPLDKLPNIPETKSIKPPSIYFKKTSSWNLFLKLFFIIYCFL